MIRTSLYITAIVGASAVALGAFGAHTLSSSVDARAMEIFRTGNLYHHLFAIFMLVLYLNNQNKNQLLPSFYLALIGIVLFSGSLYLLSVRSLFVLLPISILGPMTPIGGLFFVLAWGILLFSKKS